jgi:lipid-A-disaccharide synthase
MGFTEVIARIWTIMGLLRRIKRELAARRPGVVVLIDAPAFNFRVARMAKKLGLPVVYYISPKLWAWNRKRAFFVRDHVDRMISILPFEREFYLSFGVEVDYVGHPLLDELEDPELAEIGHEPGRIGILPGSRRSEIESLMPIFAGAAGIISQKVPGTDFRLVRAPGIDQEQLMRHWPEGLPVQAAESLGRYRAIRGCEAVMAASGTVVLESALLGVPAAVAYKLSPLTFALAKRFVKVDHVSLPNLILGERLFPEFLQHAATPANVARSVLQWTLDPERLGAVRTRLAELHELLGPPGAPRRAAEIVLGCMKS